VKGLQAAMLKDDHPWFQPAATGNNRLWTFPAVLLILVTAWAILLVILLILVYKTFDPTLIPAPVLLAVNLLSTAAIPAGLWLGLRAIHRRPFASLFGPRRWRWGLFGLAGAAWFALCALPDLGLAALQPGSYAWSFDPARFWLYLLTALLLFPLQVASEELLFRAYLTQAVGVKTRSALLALVLPAVLFGLLHSTSSAISRYGWGWMMPFYIGMGLLLGWITLRTAGLQAAMGLHLANNLYAALVVNLGGPVLITVRAYNLAAYGVIGALYLLLFELAARKRLAPAALLLVLLLAGCAPARGAAEGSPASPANSGASLALSDCTLTAKGVPLQVSARCAKLEVPENPEDPAGRKIALNLAVVKAESSAPAPDPVFLLAGGPGQAAAEAYLPLLSSLEKISFKHDLILVDQRGTGGSNPLVCESETSDELPLRLEVDPAQSARNYQACLQKWDADPRFYTTAHFARDLEAVRLALAYGQVDLIGVSYGTRAALAYLKAYPSSVRAVVLDGVVPPGWVLGQSADADTERAMQLVLGRCQAQPACLSAFPDLPGDLQRLRSDLQAAPQTVSIPDPTSGADIRVRVDGHMALLMLRSLLYSSDFSALLPLLIHSAAQGDLRPLAAQYAMAAHAEGALYDGLHYAVACSEDAPFLDPRQGGGAYAGPSLALMRAVCAVYPPNPQAQSERGFAPLDTPGLILSGEADPVTPPANGERAAALLPNTKHIVLQGMGHGNFTEGCLPNLIRQLFEEGSSKQIDPACAQRIAPPPPFISLTGPEP